MKDVLTPAELEALLNPPEEAREEEAPEPQGWSAIRRFNRFERHLPVELVVGDRQLPGELDDIGIGGARLHLEHVPASLEGEVHVRLHAPHLHVDVPARILWVKPRRRAVELGVRFDSLAPEELSDLAHFIRQTSDSSVRHPAETTPPPGFTPDAKGGRRGRGAG